MSAQNGAVLDDKLKRLKEALVAAEAEGQPPPTRKALKERFGVNDYRVRQVTSQLARDRELAAAVPAEAASLTQPAPNQTGPSEPIGDVGAPPSSDQATSGDQNVARTPRPWPLVQGEGAVDRQPVVGVSEADRRGRGAAP